MPNRGTVKKYSSRIKKSINLSMQIAPLISFDDYALRNWHGNSQDVRQQNGRRVRLFVFTVERSRRFSEHAGQVWRNFDEI